MSSSASFVSELYAAANHVAKLPPSERRRLIERALETIAGQREIVQKQGNVAPLTAASLAQITRMMKELDNGHDLVAAHLLFECADEIRRLQTLAKDNEA
ncbi:hypothetical protein ASE23_22690 [Rhizobium sp. Root73]|uniref:hypothetical protein n=1 Tax=unclassified Rhizobium TaxID=2613769 RepID=UPI00072411A5|nr:MULTISPECIES: hypothetical protein [unclassified Rhizobium]KRC11291.1 hypothetical protein ASE23_22690 [Rhizobium sp. Root73]